MDMQSILRHTYCIGHAEHTEEHRLQSTQQLDRAESISIANMPFIYDPETQQKLEDQQEDGRTKSWISESAQVFLSLIQ
jgi:hypothetical protein